MIIGQNFEYNTEMDHTLFPQIQIQQQATAESAVDNADVQADILPQNVENIEGEDSKPELPMLVLDMELPEIDCLYLSDIEDESDDDEDDDDDEPDVKYIEDYSEDESDFVPELEAAFLYMDYIEIYGKLQMETEDFKKTKKWRNRLIRCFDGITYRIRRDLKDKAKGLALSDVVCKYTDELLAMSYQTLISSIYIPLVFNVMRMLNHIRLWNSRLLDWRQRRDLLVENHKQSKGIVNGMFVRLLGYSIPREIPEEIDVKLEEILLSCIECHSVFPKQVHRVLITLLSKKYVRINESNAEKIGSFLTGFSQYWLKPDLVDDLAFMDGLVECIYQIYHDHKDEGEIVNKITSPILTERLLNLWKEKVVLIMDQRLIVRILAIIAVHSNENSEMLVERQINVCINDFYEQLKYNTTHPHFDLILLLWALMPNLADPNVTMNKNIEEDYSSCIYTWHKVIGPEFTFPLTPEASRFLNGKVPDGGYVNIIDDNKICEVNLREYYLINSATTRKIKLDTKKNPISLLNLRKTKQYCKKELPRTFAKFTYKLISSRIRNCGNSEEEKALMEALHTLSECITQKQYNELFLKKYKKKTESHQDNQDEQQLEVRVQGPSAETHQAEAGHEELLSEEEEVFLDSEEEIVEVEVFYLAETGPEEILAEEEDVYLDTEEPIVEVAETESEDLLTEDEELFLDAEEEIVEVKESHQLEARPEELLAEEEILLDVEEGVVEVYEVDEDEPIVEGLFLEVEAEPEEPVEEADTCPEWVEAEDPDTERRDVQEVQTVVEEVLEDDIDEDYLNDSIPFSAESLIDILNYHEWESEVTSSFGSLVVSNLHRRFTRNYNNPINEHEVEAQLTQSLKNEPFSSTGRTTEIFKENAPNNPPITLEDYFLEHRKMFVDFFTPNQMFSYEELAQFYNMLSTTVTNKCNGFYNVFLDVEKKCGEEVISVEPFRKLVKNFTVMSNSILKRKVDRHTWSPDITTDEIFTAGVHTLRYISARSINIHFIHVCGVDIVTEEIFPFTLVDYLEHYLYETYLVKRENYEYREWHSTWYKVKLYLGDFELPSEITLYEAVRKYGIVEDDIFSTQYVIRIKRVCTIRDTLEIDKETKPRELRFRRVFRDVMLDLHINILDLLYWLSRYAPSWLLSERQESLIGHEEFQSSEIEQHALKYLKDPFNAIWGNFPGWINVFESWPFFFTLETRKLALRVLGMDRIRAATTLLDEHQTFQGAFSVDSRYPLVQIHKEHVLDQLRHILNGTRQYSDWNPYYDNQQGGGVGVKRDVFTTISQQLLRADLKLWAVPKDEVSESGLVRTKNGLYPEYNCDTIALEYDPFSKSTQDVKFEFIGGIMAKAILDQVLFPLPLSKTLFKWLLIEEEHLCVYDLQYMDTWFYETLKEIQLREYAKTISMDVTLDPHLKRALLGRMPRSEDSLEDLCVGFVHPRLHFDLIPNGMDTILTDDNADFYLEKMIDTILTTGVSDSMIALRRGFKKIIKLEYLHMLRPSELKDLVCGVDDSRFWTIEHLKANVETTLFSADCPEVSNTFQLMCEMTKDERRRFLQFVTGCPNLPFNGFAGLEPRFHISRIPRGRSPYVLACFNKIHLPAGIKKEKLRRFYYIGIDEGLNSFGLA